MSRRNRHHGAPVRAPELAVADAAPTTAAGGEIHVRFTESDTVLRHVVHHDGTASLMVAEPEGRCDRSIVHYDSLFWTCACGATGRVGRSDDGIPFVDDDILAHEPGQNRS